MNKVANFKAKRLTFMLVLFAIFTALIFPLAQKGESLNKAFAQSAEVAKIYVNTSSSGNDSSAELGAYNNPYSNIMTAINAADEGDRILFQSNFTLTNTT